MAEKCNEACPMEPRISALEEANRQHSATHREMFARLGNLETQTAVQENKLDTILEKLDDLAEKVDALESKPGKRWESLVEKAIWAVCAAVIAFLLARVGL